MRFVVNLPNLSLEEAESLLLQQRDRIAVDVETVSLDNLLPLGIAIAISPDCGYYFFNPGDKLVSQVILQTPTVIFQNCKFDIPILGRLGIILNSYEDTKLLAYSAGILDNSLEDLSMSILLKDCPSVTSQWKKKDQGNIAIDHVKMAGMSITHACNVYALWDKLPKTDLYYEIDKPCIALLMEMEKWGLPIDQFRLTLVEQASMERANQLEQELKQELGSINLASNPQVVKALQTKGIIGTRKTKSGKESVSEESLKPLNHPLTNNLLEWRGVMKTLTTYLPALRSPGSDGRVHTRFGYTNTGRWSSSGINLQNITRTEKNDLRKCIVTSPGYTFISLDANQLEPRVIAMLSQDSLLLEDLATTDVYLAAAIREFGYSEDPEIMKQRRYDAKQFRLAITYGADAFKIAEMTSKSLEEAQVIIVEYFSRYKRLYQWIQSVKKEAKEKGYVTNLFNRIRPIPELTSGSWKLREKGEREAINSIVQGSAVDIVKKMMLYLKEILEPEVRLVLQVHDEILFEVPDRLVQDTLEKSRELLLAFPDYPVIISVGKCYGSLEEIKGRITDDNNS